MGAFTKSCSGLVGIACYYRATSVVAEYLSMLFESLLLNVYSKFQGMFKVGQWIAEDPGPWLGHAIIYKLQSACTSTSKMGAQWHRSHVVTSQGNVDTAAGIKALVHLAIPFSKAPPD